MLQHLAESLHRVLIPFLLGGALLIALLVLIVIAQRAVREIAFRREQRLRAR